MQKKDTLIFDLGNVIINLKPDDFWQKHDMFTLFDAKELQELQSTLFFNNYETGKISSADFILQLKDVAMNVAISDAVIKNAWNALLLDIPMHRIELLYQLKQTYTLILLSNTNDIHLDFILDYLQQHFGKNVFDEIFMHQFYSQKMGLRKPTKEIYERVLQLANIDATTAYFFDDKPENLIEPKKLGIKTVLVDKDIFLKELRLFL